MPSFKLSPDLVQRLNEFEKSPSQIAQEILRKLPDDITDYELMCFCIEYIGLQAQSNHAYMLDQVKTVVRMFNYGHYLRIHDKHFGKSSAPVQTTDGGGSENIQTSNGKVGEDKDKAS